MQEETKTCQNCKDQFVIRPDDSAFYQKIGVPAPPFCPNCRLQRRLAFRNERNLYKRKSSKSGKEMISLYSPDKDYVTYELGEWNADDWDPLEYGTDYDFSRSFFEQFNELMYHVPHKTLINWDAVNSEYCNFTYGNKNCYLVFGGDFNEDCLYSTFNFYSKNSSDLYWADKAELCYELTDGDGDYKATFGRFVSSSSDVHFAFDLIGCQDCFGGVNLRNQNHYFFGKKYSASEYKKLVSEIDLGSYRTLQSTKQRFRDTLLKSVMRSRRIINSPNSSGDNIHNSRNCYKCFDIFDGAENCSYIFLASKGVKDSQSCDHIGLNSELCYDSISVYPGNRILFSWIIVNCHDVQYSVNCQDCSHLFGCVGLKSKEYCIFNKQYTKEEYGKIVPRIIAQMKEVFFTDRAGRTYGYGEFFPAELAHFAYNESVAQEYFPLSKAEAANRGYAWKDPERKHYAVTKKHDELPDHIRDVSDEMLNEVVGCEHNGTCNEQCSSAFKLTKAEIDFYKRMNLPLPRLCSNCRHYQRIRQRNPLRLWTRRCMCDYSVYHNSVKHPYHEDGRCPNEFETSYAPERPEIVYCEQCYRAETT